MISSGHETAAAAAKQAVPHVQTKREIEHSLTSAGLRPRKRLGQHFLIDGNLMRRMVDAAELDDRDFVIEVGAGTGGLTDLLVARAGRILAVEVDKHLFELLCDRFSENPVIKLVNADILKGKHHLAAAVVAAIHEFEPKSGGSIKLISNLPYQVATPLLMNLIVDYPQVRRFVFTVQREVGDRITATSGTKAYGPLSIITQTLGTVSAIAHLPPHVFWPRPEVDSVMLRIDVGPLPFGDRAELHRFVSLVRGTFEHRRKTLRAALNHVISSDQRKRISERWDATRRPETFSPEEWREVFQATEFST